MLSREVILEALSRLSDELGYQGVTGEINIVGGTAMVLAFNTRVATKDVNAIFEPSAAVRDAALAVTASLDLSPDWLNDSVKGFLSPSGEFVPLESVDLPNLRVLTPVPEYMLAMKVLAARTEIAGGDVGDIKFLIRHLGLRDSGEVMDIVGRYYDPSRILPRSVYLVDEIVESLSL